MGARVGQSPNAGANRAVITAPADWRRRCGTQLWKFKTHFDFDIHTVELFDIHTVDP